MKQKDTHYYALGKEFFQKHQKRLLWLLNAPLVKTLFRKLIFKSQDLWSKGRYIGDKVIEINNSWITIDAGLQYFSESSLLKTEWENPNNSRKRRRLAKKLFIKILRGKKKDKQRLLPARTSVFFTDWNYSKMLYGAFKPFWWLMHFWDWLFADRWMPRLSFGFNTLTVYPAAGANSPVDGDTYSYGTAAPNYEDTWANLQNGVTSYSETNQANYSFISIVSGVTTNYWSQLNRSIFCFDTSPLTAAATISATILSLYGTLHADTFVSAATPNIDIYLATPAATNNLADADFTQIGTVSQTGSPITYAGFNIAGYNDFTFNATGRGNVSKTGISPFGARNANHDVANSAPTWSGPNKNCNLQGYYADNGSNKPKLVVTYTAPTTYYQTLSATESSSVSLSKLSSFYRTLSASISGVSSLGAIRPFVQIISAVEQSVASISFSFIKGKILNAAESSIAGMTKLLSFRRTLSATEISIPSIGAIKKFFRTFSASAVFAATMAKGFVFAKILNAATIGISSLSRIMTYYQTLSVVAAFKAKVIKLLNGFSVSIFTNKSKNSTIFTNKTKNSTIFTNKDKS